MTPDVVLTEGENKDLRCVVAGTPNPTIAWSKQGDELPNNVSFYFLFIPQRDVLGMICLLKEQKRLVDTTTHILTA